MGASLCMDLTRGELCREVRGVAQRADTVLDAFFSGAVDLATDDLHTGVLGADIVVLATPVRTIVSLLREIGPLLWPGTLVLDLGSTKVDICRAMVELPRGVQPVGAHPMTGKESSGFTAAEPGLYRDAPWVLSPLDRTSDESLALATELAKAVGARPLVLDAARHDRLVASISHLPFLAASALVHAVAEVGAEDELVWSLAAGGFRDTSRVAASDTQMFLDILSTNRVPVIEQVDGMIEQLCGLREMIAAGEEAALAERLAQSQQMRAGWRKR